MDQHQRAQGHHVPTAQKEVKNIFLFCLWKQKWNYIDYDAVFALHVNVYVGMGVGIYVFMLIWRPGAAIVLHDVEGSCNVAVAVVAA